MSYGYDYEGAGEQEPPAGRGRRRKAAPEPESPNLQVPAPHAPAPEPQPAYYDAQWEQSGLGWDPQAWNEAQREQYAPGQYAPDEHVSGQYASDHAAFDHHAPGPQSVDEYARHGYDSDYHESDYYEQDQRAAGALDTGARRFESEVEFASDYASAEFTPEPGEAATETTAAVSPVASASPASSSAASAAKPALPGQGAFGAAGLAVVTGIGALVATPVLAVVIGLSQVGLAVGWMRTVGTSNVRRTTVFVAAIGLAAAALAYHLVPDRAPAAMGAALGVGFVFLAADQLFRKDTGTGRHRSEALAAAVTGAAFTVLPAGYLVAQRQDSALAGACALAAAVAVLCSALVGGGTKPLGIVAGVGAGTALGALTAVTLGATAGAKGGALGGVISGLFAVIGARTADRLGAEGGDVRISSQALPVAYSAIGAVIAVQVLR